MKSPGQGNALPAGGSYPTLRRLILYVLLFALVVVAANGFAGLITRLFSDAATLASADVGELARSLAFTLIGAPLALFLWKVVWKKLDDGTELASILWGLYVAAMYTVSLVVSTSALLGTAATLIGGRSPLWPVSLSTGLAWGSVWIWHWWMWRHPFKHPIRLEDVPIVIGAAYGLLLGMFAAITALSGLFDAAINGFGSLSPATDPWWQPVLRALAWSAGGIIIWWLHWFKAGGKTLRTPFAGLASLVAGIFLPGITALSGAGVVSFVLLRLAFDNAAPLPELLAPAATAAAAAAVGSLVWRYHHGREAGRTPAGRHARVLVTSGVALATAASGLGVIINAMLALAVSSLTGSGARTLLLGGISSLLVGLPIWWRAWKPLHKPQARHPAASGRRAYLIVLFGVSAAVAIIALLVIGYRLFEFILGDVSGGSSLDRIRAPLGVLVAAGLVSGYHMFQWQREHSSPPLESNPKASAIKRVTLVTGDPGQLPHTIAQASGAKVTVWKRADTSAGMQTDPDSPDLVECVIRALDGIAADHVLLIITPDQSTKPRVEAITLEPHPNR